MVQRRCSVFLRSQEDARDATHDVFVKFVRASQRARVEDPGALLWRIATNHCLNLISRRSYLERPTDDIFSLVAGLDAFSRLEARNVLRRLFDSSPDELRYIAALYFVDGETHQRIGAIVGLSETTVRRRLAKLQAHLSNLSQGNRP